MWVGAPLTSTRGANRGVRIRSPRIVRTRTRYSTRRRQPPPPSNAPAAQRRGQPGQTRSSLPSLMGKRRRANDPPSRLPYYEKGRRISRAARPGPGTGCQARPPPHQPDRQSAWDRWRCPRCRGQGLGRRNAARLALPVSLSRPSAPPLPPYSHDHRPGTAANPQRRVRSTKRERGVSKRAGEAASRDLAFGR